MLHKIDRGIPMIELMALALSLVVVVFQNKFKCKFLNDNRVQNLCFETGWNLAGSHKARNSNTLGQLHNISVRWAKKEYH